MTPTTLAETILRDVPRYWQASNRTIQPATDGDWLPRDEVLAALTAVMDPSLSERATLTVLRLRSGLDNADRGADGERELGGVVLTMNEAADLITALLTANAALRAERDALAAELHTMKTAGIIEVAVRNPSVADYMQHWEARAEAAEAQNAALTARVEGLTGALELIESMTVHSGGEIHGVTLEHYRTAVEVMRQEASIALDDIGYGVSRAALTTEADPAEAFNKADWFWRTMDPEDCGDTPEEAINRAMLGRFCVCEIASSYSGPTRYGFIAPVLDPESDDEEFVHFATQQEAIDAAKIRAAITKEKSND